MKTISQIYSALAVAVVATGLSVGAAGAATFLGAFPGNDSIEDGLDIPSLGIDSPGLAKCDTGYSDGKNCTNPSDWEDGGAAGNYVPAFTLDYKEINGNPGFDWTYNSALVTGTMNPLDPSYIVVKQGPEYFVYGLAMNEVTGGTLEFTLGNGISHVSFYDTEPGEVPVPAAGLLLIGGLGALGAMRHRRKS